jgi:hypothetical protein
MDQTKLEGALADILKLLTEGAQAVGTAAQQEIPLLVQEILLYRFWEAVVWGSLLLIPVLVLLYTIRRAWMYKNIPDNADDEDVQFGCVFVSLMLTLGLIFTGSASLSYYMDAVKISIAPRLYLLEQVKTLVGGGQ